MPQPSIYYASGRIGVLRRTMLKKAQLERLQSAKNYADATRALAEIGFISAEGMDFQTAADQHVLKACRLVHAVTPEPLLTDCFLLRYDAHNLKILLKSRQLAQKPEFLSACGTIDTEKLRHCVADHTYGPLPQEFKAAMEALEKKIAVRFDPMLVDTELDQATFRQIFVNLKTCKNAGTVKHYFQVKADLQNMLMIFRLKAMKKNAADFAGMECEICGMSEDMETLRAARSRLRNADIVYGSREDIPWREGTFDSVYVKQMMVPISRQSISEALRVLKPGGQMLIGIRMLPTPLRQLAGFFHNEAEDEPMKAQTKEVTLSMMKELGCAQITWQPTDLLNGLCIGWKPIPPEDEEA